MNAWEIDPNLQLSVYTAIGNKFILFFNKLGYWFNRVRAVRILSVKNLVGLADGSEGSRDDDIAHCRGTSSVEAGINKIRIANFR